MWSTCFMAATLSFFKTFRAQSRFDFLLNALWTLPKLPIPTTSIRSKSVILGLGYFSLLSSLSRGDSSFMLSADPMSANGSSLLLNCIIILWVRLFWSSKSFSFFSYSLRTFFTFWPRGWIKPERRWLSLPVVMLLDGMPLYFLTGLSFSDITEDIWLRVFGALSLSFIGDSSFLLLKPAEWCSTAILTFCPLYWAFTLKYFLGVSIWVAGAWWFNVFVITWSYCF